MFYVASISQEKQAFQLVLSNHDNVECVLFNWPESEDRDFQACYDTLLDTLQTIIDLMHDVDYVFFVGTSIQGNVIYPQWFGVDHSNSNDVDHIDPSQLPKILDFGTPDIYWDR